MVGRLSCVGGVALALCACSGSAPPPTPVTLIAKNTLAYDIFVPNTFNEGGMAVETPKGLGSTPLALVEQAPCACEECTNICSETASCDCALTGDIHRIPSGQSFTRSFAGTQVQATRGDCGVGDLGPICYQPASPVPSGTYELQLCYATDAPEAIVGQNDFSGSLTESSLTCVTKSFTYPGTSEVVIEPAAPTSCSSNADCRSGQLCQQGVCSSTCLSSGVPMVGSSWDTTVTLVSNEGLFVSSDGGSGILRQNATALVGTASYNGDELDLLLELQEGVGHAKAELRIALAPGSPVVPLASGETVSVLVVTSNPASTPIQMAIGSSAATIRDAQGNLLLAADEGLNGLLLQAGDLSPFAIDFGGNLYGCATSTLCGRFLYHLATFASDTANASVIPGQTGTLSASNGSYAATLVANYSYTSSDTADCGPEPITSFDLVLSGRQL